MFFETLAGAAKQRRCTVDETALAALALALGTKMRAGDILLLDGSMGAGKTTFVRALAEGLDVEDREAVCSPTYTVCMVHPGPIELVHIDLYRWGERMGYDAEGAPRPRGLDGGAFEALGLDSDELPGPGQAMAVEWADFWLEAPKDALRLRLALPENPDHALGDGARRELTAEAGGERSQQLLDAWRWAPAGAPK